MNDLSSIPPFPNSRELSLLDKPLLDPCIELLQPRMSELTFANLFLFRHRHAYRLCRIGETPIVIGRWDDGRPYALPPLAAGDNTAAVMTLLTGDTALYLPAASWGGAATGLPLHCVADRDTFDYLYLRAELASLPGHRFHKKKNRVNYFVRRHAYEVALLGPGHHAGCLGLLETWERVRAATTEHPRSDVAPCAEAIALREPLGLEGVVVSVGGRVVAFAVGERLNRETAVCHFEKADPFLEGAGQLVNMEFCRMLFTDCTFVNREQDLGLPGLREAKLSYHPVEMVEKCRILPQGVAS